jgi:cell division protein FtsB
LQAARLPRLALIVERVLPVLILLLALVGAPALMFSPSGLPRLRALEAEIAQVRAENAELATAADQLRLQVRKLKDDPKAVERLARDELGLVRNTEVVFQFSPAR